MRTKISLLLLLCFYLLCGCEIKEERSPEEILNEAEIKYNQFISIESLKEPDQCLIFYKEQDNIVGSLFSLENNKWKIRESVSFPTSNIDRMSWKFKNFGKNEYQTFLGLINDPEIGNVILQINEKQSNSKIITVNDHLRLWYIIKQESTDYQSGYQIIALSDEEEELFRIK